MTYDYQDNVRVYASKLVTEGGTSTFSNYRVSYVYQKANQTVPVTIRVKKQADFVIQNTTAELMAGGKKQEIHATYKNIGEDPVRDAVARLSIFKPFSSTDDQAFMEIWSREMRPLSSSGWTSTPMLHKGLRHKQRDQVYDVNGDTVISESMKIPVVVKAASSSLLLPAVIVLIIIVAAGGYMYRKKQKKA
jgi:hypothetical protein